MKILLVLLFCWTFAITGCRSTAIPAPYAKLSRHHDVPEVSPGETATPAPRQSEPSKVRPVSYQQDSSTESAVAPVAEFGPSAPGPDPNGMVTLADVLQSVQRHYPELTSLFGSIAEARGKVLSTLGRFDDSFSAYNISQPLGFYQTYQNGIGISRPLYSGGEVYGNYRIGDGNFEPWFGERETNEGGEFKAGFQLPLLKDRAIDDRRRLLLTSELQRTQVESDVGSRLLFIQRMATQAYWDWVASGRAVEVQQRLLALAQTRVDQIRVRVDKGDLAEIAQIDNDRLIAKRTSDLIKARRLLEKSAIKLSLFVRDNAGNPIVVNEQQLPPATPLPAAIPQDQLAADLQTAILQRPELVELDAAREAAEVERSYAENLILPKIDLKGFAGQDVGGQTSSKGDKTPFEMQIGVLAEVPVQRREGRGKLEMANAKILQIDAKRRLTADKITLEVQDAASAVNAAFNQIQQATQNLELTRRSLELGRISFDAGDIDLITLNIYESAVADAEILLLSAQFEYFYYLAIYETAIGNGRLVVR